MGLSIGHFDQLFQLLVFDLFISFLEMEGAILADNQEGLTLTLSVSKMPQLESEMVH